MDDRKNIDLAKKILIAGLLVGTLDGLAAVVMTNLRGGDPAMVFVYISSGVFGREVFAEGNKMAPWGALFHYMIAYGWTATFFLLYPWLRRFSSARSVNAIAIGLFVWGVMNLIVLPLSRVPPLRHSFQRVSEGIIVLIFCVGLPIAHLAHRYWVPENTDKDVNEGEIA